MRKNNLLRLTRHAVAAAVIASALHLSAAEPPGSQGASEQKEKSQRRISADRREVLSPREARLKAARDARVAAEKARLEALRARGPKPKMRNPELAKFDADRSGFLEPEEIAAYQADLAKRKAEAVKAR